MVLLILFSCTIRGTKNNYYYSKEDSLIYQLIDSLIMPDSTWRKFILAIPLLPPENFSESKFKSQRDSLIQRWDTSKLYIAFDDTLIVFSKSYFSKNLKDTKSYFKYNIENVDTSYYSIFNRLVSDTTLIKRNIDIKRIQTKYNYKIISSDSILAVRKKGFHIVEKIRLSRIIFNDTFDKACFYQESICGEECGGGLLIFLEWKNNHWRIIETKSLWVS